MSLKTSFIFLDEITSLEYWWKPIKGFIDVGIFDKDILVISGSSSIRTKKYKYIRSFEVRPFYFPPNVDSGFSKELFKKMGYFDKLRPFEFLFDLEADPLERNNLVEKEEYKDILENLREELTKWMEETEDPLLKGPVFPPENAVITPPWVEEPEIIWFEKKKR